MAGFCAPETRSLPPAGGGDVFCRPCRAVSADLRRLSSGQNGRGGSSGKERIMPWTAFRLQWTHAAGSCSVYPIPGGLFSPVIRRGPQACKERGTVKQRPLTELPSAAFAFPEKRSAAEQGISRPVRRPMPCRRPALRRRVLRDRSRCRRRTRIRSAGNPPPMYASIHRPPSRRSRTGQSFSL